MADRYLSRSKFKIEETAGESDDTTSTDKSSRKARVTQGRSGRAKGAAVWLNADELSALGVEINAADWVAYRVSGGELHFSVINNSSQNQY